MALGCPLVKSSVTRSAIEPEISRDAGAADVYKRIYEAVLDHRLPPGTKLKEVPLAELFGVTRGTIRKAFARLAVMKVIELRPKRVDDGALNGPPGGKQIAAFFNGRAGHDRTTIGAQFNDLHDG